VLVKDFYNHAKKGKCDGEALRIREQEAARQERALEDHLKNEKLTLEEIWQIRDADSVF
jgi:hypothetical protein